MDHYLLRSIPGSFALNLSNLRSVSALRSTLLAAGVYLAVGAWGSETEARWAVFGALFAGFLDRADTSVWVAARTSFGMALVAFCGFAAVGLLVPWPVMAAGFVVVMAFASGLASAHSMSAARAMAFTTVLLVVPVFLPASVSADLGSGIFVAVGISVQGVGTVAAALLAGDTVERGRTARALRAVARLVDAVRDGQSDLSGIREEVALALATAEQLAAAGGVNALERRRLLRVLEGAEAVRAEALAIHHRTLSYVRDRGESDIAGALGDVPESGWPDPAGTLAPAADALRAAAASETSLPWNRRRRSRTLEEALAQVNGTDKPARLLSEAAVLLAAAAERGPTLPRPQPHATAVAVRNEIPSAIRQRSLPFRHGLRLALGTAIGCLLAWLVDPTQPAWIPMTVILVLRPDVPSTSIRVIMRATGTLVGAAIVTVLVAVLPTDGPWLLGCAFLLTLVMYALMTVNYSLFVVAIVPVVILLDSGSSAQAPGLAAARLVDVLIGCLVALIVSWIVPVWMTSRVPALVSDFALAVADWFTMLAGSAAAGSVTLNLEARLSRTQRQRYAAIAHALDIARVEPRRSEVDVEYAAKVVVVVRECLRQGQACVAPISERGVASARSAETATEVAGVLRHLAARTRMVGALDRTARVGDSSGGDEQVVGPSEADRAHPVPPSDGGRPPIDGGDEEVVRRLDLTVNLALVEARLALKMVVGE